MLGKASLDPPVCHRSTMSQSAVWHICQYIVRHFQSFSFFISYNSHSVHFFCNSVPNSGLSGAITLFYNWHRHDSKYDIRWESFSCCILMASALWALPFIKFCGYHLMQISSAVYAPGNSRVIGIHQEYVCEELENLCFLELF